MKTLLTILPALALACLMGCSGESEDSTPSASASGIGQAGGSLNLGAPAPQSKGKSTPTPAPEKPAAVDLATVDRPLDARGNPMTDLQMLNLALERYRMTSSGLSAGITTPGNRVPQGPVEEAAAAAEAATAAGSLAHINDLVAKGVIKAIPEAPAGKEYHYDDNLKVIVLRDRN